MTPCYCNLLSWSMLSHLTYTEKVPPVLTCFKGPSVSAHKCVEPPFGCGVRLILWQNWTLLKLKDFAHLLVLVIRVPDMTKVKLVV
jgi:hypothetical protein